MAKILEFPKKLKGNAGIKVEAKLNLAPEQSDRMKRILESLTKINQLVREIKGDKSEAK